MTRKEAYVGIDIGTSSIKAGLFTGGSCRVAFRPARLFAAPEGVAEQDARQLWAAAVDAVREVVNEEEGACVRAVGLSGHSPSLVAATLGGEPLTPVITWMDKRPPSEARPAGRSCIEVSGPSFEATASWIARRLGPMAGSPWVFLQPKDFIALRLTGRACTDSSSASCSCCYNGERAWDACGDQALAHALPPIIYPWEVCGGITSKAADETGLREGTPVVSGGIDAFMEALGAGVTNPGIACDATGTSTCVSLVEPAGAHAGSVRHVVPGLTLTVMPISYTGGSLKWAVSVLFPHEADSCADWTHLVFDALVSSSPGASGLVFIPHLVGERSPRQDPTARGAFIGLGPHHTRAHMLRAVLEGCSYAVRESLEVSCPGLAVEEVRAVGSGAKHASWLQTKADVLGVPYVKMAVDEGALLGAVILAAYGCGDFASIDEAVQHMVHRSRIFEPDGRVRRVYDAAYEAYREAASTLRRTHEGLGRLHSLGAELTNT